MYCYFKPNILNNIPNTDFLLSPKYRLFRHVLFWIVYLFYAVFVFHFSLGLDFEIGLKFVYVFIIDFITVYFCLHLLVTRFVVKKLRLKMFYGLFVLALVINFLINFVFLNFLFCISETCDWHDYLHKQTYSFVLSFVFISIAIGLKIFKLNLENTSKIIDLQKQKVSSELNFLKNQMNPHFLFNTLNNIYIQTRIQPAKAADMVLKLSDLLRYQLYECSEDKVLLKSEVDYLNNYIELQKIRIANAEIKIDVSGTYKGLMIYPFMFISFLENSFKHGISSQSVENFIHINIRIVEKFVIFAVKNSKIDTKPQDSQSGGIGLENIKKRLELLYPEKYELTIEDKEKYFNVELKINLE